MSRWKTTIILVSVALVLAGTTAAVAAEKQGRAKGLKALGLKFYWSLLDEGQKEQAKEIAADFLADTASDRLAAMSRLLRYKSDVAALLTKEQRKTAGKIKAIVKKLPEEKRKALFEEILNGTDRQALAERIERHASATPEDKVTIGFEILDQVYEALEPKLSEKLTLSRQQLLELRGLYEELKKDLRPLAVRLEKAKAAAKEKGLSILSAEQRAKVERFKETVTEKVLAFIRG